jgi:quercetin dioxygenase-like cupin family protein
METWDIASLDVQPHHPEVLRSEDQGRAIVLHLPAGEALQEHETHEHTWLFVATGSIELEQDGQTVTGGPGFLAHFEPQERREVRAQTDARLLMLLSPWPGDGHPSRRG